MAIAESFQAQPSSHQIRLPQDSEYNSKRNLPRLFCQIAIPALSNSQLFCTIRGSPGKESPAIRRLRGTALANPRE
jgi:hypothetical protein